MRANLAATALQRGSSRRASRLPPPRPGAAPQPPHVLPAARPRRAQPAATCAAPAGLPPRSCRPAASGRRVGAGAGRALRTAAEESAAPGGCASELAERSRARRVPQSRELGRRNEGRAQLGSRAFIGWPRWLSWAEACHLGHCS